MATESEEYLAVLKASYDYDPQAEGEISIKENQLLFLVEKTDEDWWKVKVKGESQEEESPVGLVPAAYVEPAEHTSVVKAIYDYDANAPGELSVKEDELLLVFDAEEEWLLVQSQNEGGRAGFVPGNYVEASGEEDTPSAPAPVVQKIVIPPSPPRPVSTYMDPADRVAAVSIKADDIKTWSVSEIDKKGKKKKGTLGIGNGAVFFASDADKTPVQKWRTVDVESINIDKSKHVHIDLGGPTPTALHFNAGSKDTAEAIASKLRASKSLSAPVPSHPQSEDHETNDTSSRPPPLRSDAPDHGKKNGASVHFSERSPVIIPPREPSEDGDYEAAEEDQPEISGLGEVEGGDSHMATALYDFHADGEDELSVREGERLIVTEIDGDEWWKCKNSKGDEGVVPASYLELTSPATRTPVASTLTDTDDEAEVARAAKERAEEARLVREQKMERERKEKDRLEKQRKEKERAAKEREQMAKEKERADKERAAEERAEKEQKKQEAEQRGSVDERRVRTESDKSSSRSETKSQSRGSAKASRPPPHTTRVWHDRSGQFRVEAAFIGFSNGKLRLHKINGVVVEVPAEKMSIEDMRYIETLTSKKSTGTPDDEPLGSQRLDTKPARATPPRSTPPRKSPRIDWFDFFLSAGCDLDDCTRYASSFERDKIDESILPDITDATMRSLGLREGDIIRVTKVIEKRKPQESNGQILRDEEYARQLQSEESGSRKQNTTSPAPNLFAGAGGALKNNTARRGRPQPSKSLPPASVDLNAIATASSQMSTSPQIGLSTSSPPVSSTPVQPPSRSSSALPAASTGFDDDAWTNRPSSTRPLAPTPPVVTARAPSAPPASALAPALVPAAPAPVPAPTPTASVVSPPQPSTGVQLAQPQNGNNLARTTESDIFDQLSRLSQLRKPSPAVNSLPLAASSPPMVNPPASYQSGLGMGPSPAPMGQHLQNQQTGFPLQPLQPMSIGPRGPFAPVPANQTLLQPLIPTNTGFKNFVPTRPVNNVTSPFQNQPSFLPQQPTGFPGPAQGLVSQPTGIPFGGYGGGSFANNSFSPAQTGFNPGFGQLPTNNGIFSPPPVPPLPATATPNNTSPANVFAQMKSGTFATGNDTAQPQPSIKYDALRPNTLVPQATGWGPYQTINNGYHMGYQQ